jgi:hypothetical protein
MTIMLIGWGVVLSALSGGRGGDGGLSGGGLPQSLAPEGPQRWLVWGRLLLCTHNAVTALFVGVMAAMVAFLLARGSADVPKAFEAIAACWLYGGTAWAAILSTGFIILSHCSRRTSPARGGLGIGSHLFMGIPLFGLYYWDHEVVRWFSGAAGAEGERSSTAQRSGTSRKCLLLALDVWFFLQPSLLGLAMGLIAAYGQWQGNQAYLEWAKAPVWAAAVILVAVSAFVVTVFASIYSAERHGWTGLYRGLWAFGILLGAPVAVPAYWFFSWRARVSELLRVRPGEEPDAPEAQRDARAGTGLRAK